MGFLFISIRFLRLLDGHLGNLDDEYTLMGTNLLIELKIASLKTTAVSSTV